MASVIENFIIVQNINLYRSLLKTETFSSNRRILLELLKNEFAKLPDSEKRTQMAEER